MRWIVLVWLLLVEPAHAQLPGAPGALATSHATFTCDACHPNQSTAASCAGCHDALLQRGLHAQPNVRAKVCAACHDEHRGARADIIGWKAMPGGMAGFDHERTGWPLQGRHRASACVRCHTGTMASGATRFTGLSTTCGASGCHRANPHRFAGPEFLRCDRCHTDAAWRPVKGDLEFDHDRETKLPLVGGHRNVACVGCHPRNEFPIAKAECVTCHASPKHESPRFDTRPCDQCHSPRVKTFATYGFDHDERTKFPLLSGHRIPCARCHTQALGTAPPSTRCESCHPGKTPHGKRFDHISGGCAACHDGSKWATTKAFAHGKHTKFPLTARHATIPCRGCHRASGPSNFERFKRQLGCKECHAHTKVHADAAHPQGKYTSQQCTGCHSNDPIHGPPDPARFVHGPGAAFPLVKGHRDVPCTDCHVGRDLRGRTRFDGLSNECGDKCHEDTAHLGALGNRCARCHVPGVWKALSFEHTAYALEGAHRDAACEACHGSDQKFKGTPRRCGDAACHARDDVHRGALGATCDRCHLANGDNRFNHAISAKFKLDGKHVAVACGDCHPSRTFKPRPMSCNGCHAEPRAHFGKYGTGCERCHTTKGWR